MFVSTCGDLIQLKSNDDRMFGSKQVAKQANDTNF